MKLNKTETAILQRLNKDSRFVCEAIMERGRTWNFREYNACLSLIKKGLVTELRREAIRGDRLVMRIFGRLDGCISSTSLIITIAANPTVKE